MNQPVPTNKSFWQRLVLDVIVAQLKQGITPKKISLTIALGVTLGIFPILGATSLLCLGAGIWLKLNQPIIQTLNYLAVAAQLALIPFFVRVGEHVTHAQPASFSLSEMFRVFHESPAKFFHQFGLIGLDGIIGWLVISPILAFVLYLAFLPVLNKLAQVHFN